MLDINRWLEELPAFYNNAGTARAGLRRMRANAELTNIEGTESHGERRNIAKQGSMNLQPLIALDCFDAARHGMPEI